MCVFVCVFASQSDRMRSSIWWAVCVCVCVPGTLVSVLYFKRQTDRERGILRQKERQM